MPENANEAQKKDVPESKKISRRQFITGTTEGAVSYGVFDNPIVEIVSAFASKIDAPRLQEEQKKRMLELAKRPRSRSKEYQREKKQTVA